MPNSPPPATYVAAGGILLIDSCGGGPFAKSADQSLIAKAFANDVSEPLSPDAPLMKPTADGMIDLGKPLLRPTPP